MVEIGTRIDDERGDWRSRVALALETYARHPDGKHQILETMAARGVPLPDTPPMAVHRGRLDLLENCLRRDPLLLERTFTHQEIFPPALGCHADESLALVGAQLGGATLLHIAADYEELDVVRWLLDQGMRADARAIVDSDGFGGHTALFNCVVTHNAGRRDDRVARLLRHRVSRAAVWSGRSRRFDWRPSSRARGPLSRREANSSDGRGDHSIGESGDQWAPLGDRALHRRERERSPVAGLIIPHLSDPKRVGVCGIPRDNVAQAPWHSAVVLEQDCLKRVTTARCRGHLGDQSVHGSLRSLKRVNRLVARRAFE
jgi:hypothetical protein